MRDVLRESIQSGPELMEDARIRGIDVERRGSNRSPAPKRDPIRRSDARLDNGRGEGECIPLERRKVGCDEGKARLEGGQRAGLREPLRIDDLGVDQRQQDGRIRGPQRRMPGKS